MTNPHPDPSAELARDKLKVGAVYQTDDDPELFVCADDQPDSQKDVLVVNFGGRNGFAHFQLCGGDKLIANSLAEYVSLLESQRDEARRKVEELTKLVRAMLSSATPNKLEHPTMHAIWRDAIAAIKL